MIRTIKAIGLSLIALAALGALSATAASAAPEFTSQETPSGAHVHTIIEGDQEEGNIHKFTAGGGFGAISCKKAHFTGTSATGTDTTLDATPEYGTCSDSFGRTVDVVTTGCKYRFHATTRTSVDNYTGHVSIICEAGKQIEAKVTSGGSVICTVAIGSQEKVGPIDFIDKTTLPTDVTVDATATNVKNTTSGGSLNCGIANGEHTEGTYTGSTTVIGRNTAGTQIDIDVVGV